MTTTTDQDRAIEAIMAREGYAAVEVHGQTGRYVCVEDRDSDSTLGHFVRQDGAEIDFPTDQGVAVLGYPGEDS